MVDKPVLNKTVAKTVAAKPVAKPAPVAKALAAAKPDAPQIAPAVMAQPAVVAPAVTTPVAATETATPAIAAALVAAPTPTNTQEAVKAPAIAEGKTNMNDTIANVQENAKKFTTDATERANEMFGDVSARAKTAMEKGSKGLEDMVEFSKGNLEAVVASTRVAAKGAQDIARYSAEYGRKSIEEANATAKKFAAVKSPTEFFALQSEVAKANLDAMVGEASKFAEGYMKLLGEIVQPIQNRYAVAAEKVKSATAA